MRDCDLIWNRAALDGGGIAPQRGDQALADVLVAHGLIMNGGVLHALELLDPNQVQRAASGMEYFGLAQASCVLLETLETLNRLGGSEKLEAEANARYWAVLADDTTLAERFEQVFVKHPGDFASLGDA